MNGVEQLIWEANIKGCKTAQHPMGIIPDPHEATSQGGRRQAKLPDPSSEPETLKQGLSAPPFPSPPGLLVVSMLWGGKGVWWRVCGARRLVSVAEMWVPSSGVRVLHGVGLRLPLSEVLVSLGRKC